MKKIFKTIRAYQAIIIILTIIFALGLAGPVIAYYQIPTWSSDFGFGLGGPQNYLNYNSYQTFAAPYLYGPAMGVYYPYNTMFDIYSGAYSLNRGYNQNLMGYYTSGNYGESGQRDINAIGYPLPYGYIDQMAWGNQQSTASGFWGYPPYTSSYSMGGNPYNVYYDPGAFTLDLGIDTYMKGVRNFWTGVFERLNEDEENE